MCDLIEWFIETEQIKYLFLNLWLLIVIVHLGLGLVAVEAGCRALRTLLHLRTLTTKALATRSARVPGAE